MAEDMKIPETTEEVLKIALEMEEEGYRTYTDGAKKVHNSLGRRMLERLAQDEIAHMERIREAYEALEGKRSWEDVSMHNSGDAPTFENIFNRLRGELNRSLEELGQRGVDDEEVIETALNLESHGKFFYAEAAKKAKDLKVKEFLEILAKEEESHYKALRNINNFMADPANWFATQGKF
ncbi:MAG: ferritin family protein [Calditrichia bacterium]